MLVAGAALACCGADGGGAACSLPAPSAETSFPCPCPSPAPPPQLNVDHQAIARVDMRETGAPLAWLAWAPPDRLPALPPAAALGCACRLAQPTDAECTHTHTVSLTSTPPPPATQAPPACSTGLTMTAPLSSARGPRSSAPGPPGGSSPPTAPTRCEAIRPLSAGWAPARLRARRSPQLLTSAASP